MIRAVVVINTGPARVSAIASYPSGQRVFGQLPKDSNFGRDSSAQIAQRGLPAGNRTPLLWLMEFGEPQRDLQVRKARAQRTADRLLGGMHAIFDGLPHNPEGPSRARNTTAGYKVRV